MVASDMEYLTDRLYGRPTQTIQGNPEQPVTIQLQWSSTPEWLTSVTVNQHVNHITTSTDRAEEIRQVIGGQTRPLKPQNVTSTALALRRRWCSLSQSLPSLENLHSEAQSLP